MFRFDEFVAGCFLGFALGIMAIAPVKADTVQIHLASKHLTGKNFDFNEFNPGLSVTKDMSFSDDGYWLAGAYYNSIENLTVLGGAGWGLPLGPMEVGLEFGVATGYEYTITPIVSPTIRTGYAKFNLIPIMSQTSEFDGVALGLSLEFEYD